MSQTTMSQCVFCDSAKDLNTQFNITLDDGQKITVSICDTHAEDATIKTAKASYLDRQKKIDEVIAQARALGLNITGMQQHGNLQVPIVERKPQPQPPQPQSEIVHPQAEDLTGDGVVSTEVLDRAMMSIGGSTEFGHVSGHSSHAVRGDKSTLPPNVRQGKAQLVMIEGREGMPLAIPEKRVDGTGTTRIKVNKKEDDVKLQSRFKKMAKDSIDHDRVPNFARQGYQNTQIDCPLCSKSKTPGIVLQGGKEITCPKCNGSMVISLY